jgi:hypothetical protein
MKGMHALLSNLLVAGCFFWPAIAGAQVPDFTQDQVTGVEEDKFHHLGPTGMKGYIYWSTVNFTTDARQILVTEVPAGSPADGVFEYHDVILGINGGVFTNDARYAFVDAIEQAEATGNGGQLYLTVFRPSTGVTDTRMVQLQELGTLSATTPYSCPKSDTILTNYCEYVYTNGPHGAPIEVASIWAMLASGEPKYVNWATNWVKSQPMATRTDLDVYKDTSRRVWNSAYELITLCQYQLLTGDADVLPSIADLSNFIAQGQDQHGLWNHSMAWPVWNGGELHGTLSGYGALNNAALAALYGLVLAQKCGISDAEVDAAVVKGAHFYRSHVGIGAINYGFNPPLMNNTDSNGRMGIAAHLFRALGEPAAAKWFAMMTSTYKWRDWGHCGNDFNHCWGPMAAGIGGPELANFVHTEREVQGPYYQVSLTLRRKPDGRFDSLGEPGGRGAGGNGMANGGYGVQLAANRQHIEMTGAGYNTADYWLTAEEMAQVRFAHRYEADTAGLQSLSTTELLANLDCFCPKIALAVGDALALRVDSDPALLAQLISIVEDAAAPAGKRGAALKGLGSHKSSVTSTTDQWFYPSSGTALNWAAAMHADVTTVTSQVHALSSITQFDADDAFAALTLGFYAQVIYNMDRTQLDAAQLEIYYAATARLLQPDVVSRWFVDQQKVWEWDPAIVANYADSLLQAAEARERGYEAQYVLARGQYAEGMHACAAILSTMGNNATLSAHEWGQHWSWYTDYTRALHTASARLGEPDHRRVIELVCNTPVPGLVWFRDLISANLDAAYTNSATQLADLRADMAKESKDDLRDAICLDKIVSHPNNPDPFIDITAAVGSTTPIKGTHWRRNAGAVELGIADANPVSRWLTELTAAEAAGDAQRMAGILHVLAGKAAPEAVPIAVGYLAHANDGVVRGALDVMARVGTKDELLAVFNCYMTNSSISAISEDGTAVVSSFKDEHWMQANWDAISGIAGRDYAGCLTVADSLAASFNTHTQNGASVATIPHHTFFFHPRPFSILTPVLSQREVVGGAIGIYAALGLFAKDNAACLNALISVQAQQSDTHYTLGHEYCAGDAVLKNYTVPEIVAIENGGGTNLWTERAAMYYLFDQVILGNVPPAGQRAVFEVRNGKYQEDGQDYFYYGNGYQMELNYRRGLEETDGVFFFGVD